MSNCLSVQTYTLTHLDLHDELDHRRGQQQAGREPQRLPPVRRGQVRPQLQILLRADPAQLRDPERH